MHANWQKKENMCKKRILYLLLGFILVAIGFILIIEGGFRISRITYDDLPKYAEPDIANNSSCLLGYSEECDVVIAVYLDKYNSFHILEFSRNLMVSKYSLVDTHIYNVVDQPFYSVVSTSFYDYPYCVDIANWSIEIFEKSISSTPFYSLFIISLGCAIIASQKRSNKNEKTR